jgi:hypothetical protein
MYVQHLYISTCIHTLIDAYMRLQRASMEYMRSLDVMRPEQLGKLPVIVVSRDPAKGAGGGLFPNAKGDPQRESQHEVCACAFMCVCLYVHA